MTYLDKKFLLIISLLITSSVWSDISKLKIVDGFMIEEFVTEIDDARQMVEGENYIFVGTKSAGIILSLIHI